MPQLLKPKCRRACDPQEKPLQWEAGEPQLERNSRFLQLEKAKVQQQRCSTAKNKFLNKWINKNQEATKEKLGNFDYVKFIKQKKKHKVKILKKKKNLGKKPQHMISTLVISFI